jgi:uncharacterized repeat protein (TIGR02543 family)
VVEGQAYTLVVPTRSVYVFIGWWTSIDNTGTRLTDEEGRSLNPWTISSNIEVYAHWGISRTVTYNANGGTVSPSSATVVTSLNYTLAVPTRDGYSFGGWYSAVDAGGNVMGTQLTGASGASLANWEGGDATVYAKWTANTYTVTYNAAGGTVNPSTATVTYDSDYTLAKPTRSGGYGFSGWWTTSDDSGVQLTDGEGKSLNPWAIASNTTVYAHWGDPCTITYNAAGGTVSPSTATIAIGVNYTLAVPTRSYYTFGGWYSAVDTEGNATGAQLTGADGASLNPWPGGNATVYARWTANTYTVTYNAGSGTVSPSTATVTYGSSYTLAVPTRSGYAFGGWWTQSGGTGTQLTGASGASLAAWSTGNATVYAKWKATLTVTYYTGDGCSVSPSSAAVVEDEDYTLAVPTRVGYIFAGWYSALGGTGTQLTGADGASLNPWTGGNATVYAGWTANTLNLTAPASGTGWTYDSTSKVFTILDGASVRVAGSTTQDRIVVAAGATATVLLDGALIRLSSGNAISGFDLGSGANVTLLLSGASEILGRPGAAGIHVPEGRTLLIDSAAATHSASGTVTVEAGLTSNVYGAGAGIGGNMSEAAGTITITGGTVNATGAAGGNTYWAGAAGIGGGGDWTTQQPDAGRGNMGTIVISGGVVNAYGHPSNTNYPAGPGIGGGCFAQNTTGSITITGGTVTAVGGESSAGIGGGQAGNGGHITITGGTVIAKGGESGAGIGGGSSGSGGVTTISGGTVFAQAGQNIGGEAAAIGGGGVWGYYDRGRAGNITISGGVVVAYDGIRSATPAPMAAGNQNISITGGTVIAGGLGIGRNDGEETLITFSGSPVVLASSLLQDDTPAGAFTGARLVGSSQVTFTFSGTGNVSTAGTVTLQTPLSIPTGATLTVPAGWILNRNGFTVTGNVVE